MLSNEYIIYYALRGVQEVTDAFICDLSKKVGKRLNDHRKYKYRYISDIIQEMKNRCAEEYENPEKAIKDLNIK